MIMRLTISIRAFIPSTLAGFTMSLLNCVQASRMSWMTRRRPCSEIRLLHDLKQIGLLIDRQMLDCFQDFIKCHLCHAVHLSQSSISISTPLAAAPAIAVRLLAGLFNSRIFIGEAVARP